jgi:hypothetical protein
MMVLFSSAIVLVAMIFQATAPPLMRPGDVARRLSEPDVADIERAVSPRGAQPWLLHGPHGRLGEGLSWESVKLRQQGSGRVTISISIVFA